MNIINGKEIADNLQNKLKEKLTQIPIKPKLKVIIVGENPASLVYIGKKQKKAQYVGIESSIITLSNDISQIELIKIIEELNNDPTINGILVQLPLPKQISELSIINAIDPNKDVDCFHVENVGKLAIGNNNFIPCTPYGCLYLIKHALGNNLSGLDALIVGRSNIVGKPMAQLLLQENCTVTIAHSNTRNLEDKLARTDIIVAAAGKPRLIKNIKEGATVIDVGINKVEDKLVGDVDFDAVAQSAKAITPVPGGVGPMTVTFLLVNTIIAACNHNGIKISINEIIQ